METEPTQHDDRTDTRGQPTYFWLERLTGGVLLLLLCALGWMVAAANWPSFARLPSVAHEVVLLLILLGASLLLVAFVALLHTRR